MKPTYFTCTLGQATALNLTDKLFKNINEFIASRARSTPNQHAVGFAIPSPAAEDKLWETSIWTFSDVFEGTKKAATLLSHEYGEALKSSRTVALICPSTPEFLFTWLALMQLGHAVLLVAPQCQPAAIAHLCKTCGSNVIFYDNIYASQAHEAAQLAETDGSQLKAAHLPFSSYQQLDEVLTRETAAVTSSPQIDENDIAYLHHTSGTSSGVPKSIPQTHRAGAGVLPEFPDGKESATFTTTPLYHGGIADLFRAWSSGALIWLFPGKGVPITATNVVRCLDAAAEVTKKQGVPPVKYFSSVPYVLQMMEANDRGLRYLQGMDIVGVGGAALPTEVGDRMVEEGVNLISRFGSAECGFLMSSHRDYDKDKEWQYLRSNEGGESLKFEKQEGDLVELVVLQGWPHMVRTPETVSPQPPKRLLTKNQAKKNRQDGSYATADLFALHKSIPDARRYDSRADSQLTLITGKKFDPAPLEGAISTSDLLEDVLIFGNGQPFPGALLFRSEKAQQLSDPELTERIWSEVQKLNAESQDHARIPHNMLVPMQILHKPLEKSSKGTIIRGATETRFADTIEEAYNNMGSLDNTSYVPDEELPRVIKDMIEAIVPQKGPLELDTDLFSFGLDSVAGMQVRHGMRQLVPQSTKQLPLNIVEDCGTVARLADYVVKQRHGLDVAEEDDESDLMLQLIDKYSKFTQRPRPLSNGGDGHAKISSGDSDHQIDGGKDVIVLTGATGALGTHILALYRDMESVSKIYCLVRGADKKSSRQRVSEALEQRGFKGLSSKDAKIEVLQASLGNERLGLSDLDYNRITKDVSIVMHVAWSVNFRMRLHSFADENIPGEWPKRLYAGQFRRTLSLTLGIGRRELQSRPAYVKGTTADDLPRLQE